MRRLGLVPWGGGAHLSITVANGEHMSCEGIAHDVPIIIGGETFPVTCVGLTLGCFDFILGVNFLGMLGPLLWDFKGLTVAFQRDDRCMMWQCIGPPSASMKHQPLAAVTANPQHPLLEQLLL